MADPIEDTEGLLIVAIVAVIGYLIWKFLQPQKWPCGNPIGWPQPGQQATNIGGQTVGTSTSGTQFNIHSSGFFGSGNLWTVFPSDGSSPIVDINANTDPIGPGGQTISQLQGLGWTNQQIADMIGMSAPGGGC